MVNLLNQRLRGVELLCGARGSANCRFAVVITRQTRSVANDVHYEYLYHMLGISAIVEVQIGMLLAIRALWVRVK